MKALCSFLMAHEEEKAGFTEQEADSETGRLSQQDTGSDPAVLAPMGWTKGQSSLLGCEVTDGWWIENDTPVTLG